jgi:hypothetical protein
MEKMIENARANLQIMLVRHETGESPSEEETSRTAVQAEDS